MAIMAALSVQYAKGGTCTRQPACVPRSISRARSIARRAERSAVAAAHGISLNPLALAYLNRLSDWLFVAARYANGQGQGDILWVPGASR